MKLREMGIQRVNFEKLKGINFSNLQNLDRDKLLDWLLSPLGLRVSYLLMSLLGILILLMTIAHVNDFRSIHSIDWQQSTPPPRMHGQTQARVTPLATWHLFGVDEETLRVAQGDLELRGIFVGKTADTSTCVIAASGGDEVTYGVGDQLADGSKILHVLPDRVVLEHNGNVENLFLKPDSAVSTGADSEFLGNGDQSDSTTDSGSSDNSNDAGSVPVPLSNKVDNEATPTAQHAPPVMPASTEGSAGLNKMIKRWRGLKHGDL